MVLGKFAGMMVDEAIGDDPGSRRQERAWSRPSNLASTNFERILNRELF
jgi:hypothetical protein